VYEVERFAISSQPTVAELNARKFAIDVATQSGWDVVTHDADMNYYFVKDKAGDETDEFYDDAELRQERAERYRNHHCYDMPVIMLGSSLFLAIIYILIAFFFGLNPSVLGGLFKLYLVINLLNIILLLYNTNYGQRLYREFLMSREEWETYKEYSTKRSFNKVQQLRSFLQEQSEFGLSLTGYQQGRFLFEKDTAHYNYFVDTKACLKKRLGAQETTLDDSKDIFNRGLKWYEISIAEAEKYHLKPVAVIKQNILIYKRPYSEQELPWENGNETIGWSGTTTLRICAFFVICFIIGLIIGLVAALFII
jgi:hypothetical protein